MRPNFLAFAVVLMGLSLNAQCKLIDGGSSSTQPLTPLDSTANVIELPVGYDEAWRAMVAKLSESAFVIDTMDKDSGLITIAFSLSDATEYIDCGTLHSWVKNLRGRREYTVANNSPRSEFEYFQNGTIALIRRTSQTSGKVNIFVSSVTKTRTRIKATAKFVFIRRASIDTREFDSRDFSRKPPVEVLDDMSFVTGQEGRFANGLTCRSTIKLESSYLTNILPNPSTTGLNTGP